jgi:hypothetical protein
MLKAYKYYDMDKVIAAAFNFIKINNLEKNG